MKVENKQSLYSLQDLLRISMSWKIGFHNKQWTLQMIQTM